MASSTRLSIAAALFACALSLAACGPRPSPSSGEADDGFIARTTRQAIERARDELATADISVGGKNGHGFNIGGSNQPPDGHPPAQISPQGDFLVDGQPVPIDSAQRELLLTHRANIIAVADAGLEVGLQGATLGLEAARGALGAVFKGSKDEFEQRIEAESGRIELAARAICDRLPALLDSQQALADALPAFAPYATMTQADVDDCRRDRESDRPMAAADAGEVL